MFLWSLSSNLAISAYESPAFSFRYLQIFSKQPKSFLNIVTGSEAWFISSVSASIFSFVIPYLAPISFSIISLVSDLLNVYLSLSSSNISVSALNNLSSVTFFFLLDALCYR